MKTYIKLCSWKYCLTHHFHCFIVNVILIINLIDMWAIALVLVPTRELCLQVYEILQKLLHRFHWIVPGYVMGGENRSKEKARLRKGKNHVIMCIHHTYPFLNTVI